MAIRAELPPVASTGIKGLDGILHGGLPIEEMHLVQGMAGTGKTTLGLHFLRAGVDAGEAVMYVTLSQSKQQLARIARSHGWELDGIHVHELAPGTVAERIAARQTIVPTAEVQIGELFTELVELVARVRPRRAVIDSLSVLQLLAGSAVRYHEEVVTLRQMFIEQGCTVLAITDHPAEADHGQSPEVVFHPLCGCVIHMSQQGREFGEARRRLRIVKARGLPQNGGYHDVRLQTGRLDVFERLAAYEQPERGAYTPVLTGVPMLDRMLGGGLETGTTCLIVGPSGTGKSTLSTLWVSAMARDGKKGAMFLFDERPETYIRRSEGLGVTLRPHLDAGTIRIEQVDPGEIAPGEFAQRVRDLVDREGVKVIVIDSIIGYFAAMGSADVLMTQLHELLTYLARNDALLIMCGVQEGFMSIGAQQAVDISYLSDTVVALAIFETQARLRRAIVVVKKKHGTHLSTIHEIVFRDDSIEVREDVPEELQNIMVKQPAPAGWTPRARRD